MTPARQGRGSLEQPAASAVSLIPEPSARLKIVPEPRWNSGNAISPLSIKSRTVEVFIGRVHSSWSETARDSPEAGPDSRWSQGHVPSPWQMSRRVGQRALVSGPCPGLREPGRRRDCGRTQSRGGNQRSSPRRLSALGETILVCGPGPALARWGSRRSESRAVSTSLSASTCRERSETISGSSMQAGRPPCRPLPSRATGAACGRSSAGPAWPRTACASRWRCCLLAVGATIRIDGGRFPRCPRSRRNGATASRQWLCVPAGGRNVG